jgi:hypothetical protein
MLSPDDGEKSAWHFEAKAKIIQLIGFGLIL